jgi:signal transduction histidine kinase
MRFGDIPAKLMSVFGALVLTIAAVGFFAHAIIGGHERSVARTTEANAALLAASRVEYGLTRQENSVRGFLLSGDRYYLDRIEMVHRRGFEEALANLKQHDGDAARVTAIAAAYADYRARVIEPIGRLEGEAARRAAFDLVRSDGIADRAIEPAEAAITRAVADARERIAAESAVQAQASRQLRVALLAGILIVGLLTLWSAVWLSRTIADPVVRLSRAMDAVRDGVVADVRVQPAGDDEIGRLTVAFNEMVTDLRWHDASLRRALAELSGARDAAEASNRLKSEFLANMSHEIRTPLNGVLGMVQAIRMDELSPRQQERVGIIQSSAEALLSMVDDLLELARMESGKVELDVAPFDLGELVQAAAAPFANRAQAHGIAFAVTIDSEVDGAWLGDAGRLSKVVEHLTSNAVKFTAQGRVCVKAMRGETGVRISVRDTGVGIPIARQADVFRNFTQIDGSATRRFGGSGLGLALCRELTQAMGGTITVESVEGEGSCFTLDLPLARGAQPEAVAA